MEIATPDAAGPLSGREALDLLTRVNIRELLESFRVDRPGLRVVARALFRAPSVIFSRQLLEMDRRVAAVGLSTAARWLLERHADVLEIRGGEALARTGPLLVASNHPGLSDTLALMGAIGRDDLRIIAAERPMLRALPNISRALCYVSERDGRRGDVLREAGRHLRAGGAVLTFPAGEIEPDPSLHDDAVDTVPHWSESVGVLVRAAPEVAVVPALVSGVASPAARRNPLVKLYRTRKQREWVAATLQAMVRRYRRDVVTVWFGPVLRFGAGTGRARIMAEVRASILRLIGCVRDG